VRYRVEVGVALARPPREDRRSYFVLEAESGAEAELLAQQWAGSRPGVVMPVASVVTDWDDGR
jgi:hypothetical protein